MDLKQYIREVKDFPKPGIDFKDITPLIQNPGAFRTCIDQFVSLTRDADVIMGLDARWFLFAGAVAYESNKPLVIIRKTGKLPYKTISVDYELEYGKNTFEINIDAIKPGDRVAIIDDLLATGWTALAACQLVEKLGGVVDSINCAVDLSFLPGREVLRTYTVNSLISY